MLDGAGRVARWAAGAVAPMFAPPTNPRGLAWTVHFVLVLALAVGCYFLQPHVGITGNLGGPAAIQPFWLAALFLLAYALLWAAAWLWSLLAPEAPSTAFPDIDEAWDEVRTALDGAGVGLADTPVYLVLGSHPGGLDPVFRGVPGGLLVTGGTTANSPLKVYANRDGVYLCVPGAGLLGTASRHAPVGDSGGFAADQSIGIAGQSVGIGAASVGADSIGVGGAGPMVEIQAIIRQAREANRPLNDAERARVRALSGAPSPAQSHGPASERRPAALDPAAAAHAAARLAHVCHLLGSARWPLCPANGAILAVPADVTDTELGASQWGLTARHDLAAVEAATRLQFPVYALVGGAEAWPGGSAFFTTFAADKGTQRLGKGFPLNPGLAADGVGPAIETATGWVFGGLLGYWAVRQLRAQSDKDNAELVRFLAELRRRGANVAKLVARATTFRPDGGATFGGCYLAAVTPDDPAEAKFVREFFRKAESTQGSVAWTADAYARDDSYRSAARLANLAALVIVAGVLGLAGYVGWLKFGR